MSAKIIHLITDLNTGGAEISLYRLLGGMDRERFENHVISLIPVGPVGEKIRALNIPVRSLNMQPGRPSFGALLRLIKLLKLERPDIVQTWMYHADLIGGLAAKFGGGSTVVWGIHNSTLDSRLSKRITRIIVRILAWLSPHLPTRIVSCSMRARDTHVQLGYRADKFNVIFNGFDLSIFHPDGQARADIRTELGIASNALLVGMIARYDPQKDLANFIHAAALLEGERKDVLFLLCGDGIDWKNKVLVQQIAAGGLIDRCFLLGRRQDIPRILTALDINTLSSAYGEAFPLVLGEAMACGIPCVTTDVGDSAFLVGDTGVVVPANDPQALAKGWQKLIDAGAQARQQLGEAGRRRIAENFSLDRTVAAYQDLYAGLAARPAKAQKGKAV